MKKLFAAALLAAPMAAFASPIDAIGTTLFGDTRPGTPDGIIISVDGVQRGANENIFDFTVDFTAGMDILHPDAKLLEFYFNVNPTDPGQWAVSDVTAGYSVNVPATVQGGGNPFGFLFELDAPGGPDDNVPLTFALTYAGGEIMSENFINAPDWESNDPSITEAQLGAHVGGLGPNGLLSGFAVADWGLVEPTPVAAPGNLALLGLGLVGLMLQRRRKA